MSTNYRQRAIPHCLNKKRGCGFLPRPRLLGVLLFARLVEGLGRVEPRYGGWVEHDWGHLRFGRQVDLRRGIGKRQRQPADDAGSGGPWVPLVVAGRQVGIEAAPGAEAEAV